MGEEGEGMTPEQFKILCKRMDAQTEAIVSAVSGTSFSNPTRFIDDIMVNYYKKIGGRLP